VWVPFVTHFAPPGLGLHLDRNPLRKNAPAVAWVGPAWRPRPPIWDPEGMLGDGRRRFSRNLGRKHLSGWTHQGVLCVSDPETAEKPGERLQLIFEAFGAGQVGGARSSRQISKGRMWDGPIFFPRGRDVSPGGGRQPPATWTGKEGFVTQSAGGQKGGARMG